VINVSVVNNNGYVRVQWKLNGEKHYKSFGKDTPSNRAKAEAYNAQITRQLADKSCRTGPKFSEVAGSYLKHKSPLMSAVSFDNLLYKLERIILPTLGEGILANMLIPLVMDDYVSKRAELVKLTTVHRELSDIRAILNYGVERGLIIKNPMRGYSMPKRDDTKIFPLAHDEIQKVIDCSAPHLKRAMLLSYFTGLRPGAVELLSIQYSQVNWTANSITIISAAKGGAERREVPIHRSLPLRAWYEEDGCRDDSYIITWNGKPVMSLKTAFNAAKRRAGIENRKVPLYSLRHAFVTALLHKGVPLHTIANISGHDVRTMLKHYAHVMDGVRVSAIDMLPDLQEIVPPGYKFGKWLSLVEHSVRDATINCEAQ